MRRARGRYASDSPEPKTPEKNPEDVPTSPTTPGSMFASMSKTIGRTLAWRGTSTKSKSDDDAEVHLDPKTGLPMSPRSLALKRGQYIPPRSTRRSNTATTCTLACRGRVVSSLIRSTSEPATSASRWAPA